MRRSMLVLALLATPLGAIAEESATEEYARIKGSTPRTADAQAKLALWCEAHGLEAQKARHLALALALEPRHALARGLMGLVEHKGRWLTPEGVAKAQREDAAAAELRAEYVRRRDGAAMTAEGQWKLAEWCRAKGLEAEARAHTENVVRWEPGRDEAWAKLGYKKRDGRWMRPEAIELARVEAEAQQKADKAWMPKLKGWKGALKGARREKALGEMEGVKDPRAVPSILAVFAKGSGDEQRVGVKLLGQIDSVGATRALAAIAVFGGDGEGRREAGEMLRDRDPREYLPALIGLIRKPYKYELKPVSGPGGQGKLVVEGEKSNLERTYSAPSPLPKGANAMLGRDPNTGVPTIIVPDIIPPRYWEGEIYGGHLSSYTVDKNFQLPRYGNVHPVLEKVGDVLEKNVRSSYAVTAGYAVGNPGSSFVVNPLFPDATALSVAISMHPIANPGTEVFFHKKMYERTFASYPLAEVLAEAHRSATAAGLKQKEDVELVEAINADIRGLNDRVRVILKDAAKADLGDDREAWRTWWADAYLGYRYDQKSQPNPTYYENVTPYQPRVAPQITPITASQTNIRLMSCFAGGTRVETLEGRKAIEGIRVGDRVLSQDVGTGALGYRPVVTTFHNPPQEVYKLVLGEGPNAEEIQPTQYHRFWVAGRGWVMARELKEGDAIRTLGGVRRVSSIGKGEVQPVFNLEVAETSSYFVGSCGALAHDNMLPKAGEHPFDAE